MGLYRAAVRLLALACAFSPAAMAGDPYAGGFQLHYLSSMRFMDVKIVDLDGDGALEVAGLMYPHPAFEYRQFIVWYELGDASALDVVERTVYERTDQSHLMEDLSIADVNGDGALDILVSYQDLDGGSDETGILWLENDGQAPPSFSRRELVVSELCCYRHWAFDADGDSDVDVLSISIDPTQVQLWLNSDGAGGAWSVMNLSGGEVEGYPSDVHLVDWDDDGDDDIVFFRTSVPQMSWFERIEGPGLFAPEASVPEAYAPHPIASPVTIADVDGDGDLDVVPSSFHTPSYWWEQDDELLWPRALVEARRKWRAVADVDGDGLLDVLGTAFSALDPETLLWQRNLGGGQFGEESLIADGEWGAEGVADLDADGDPDVIAWARNGGSGIVWMENKLDEPPAQQLAGDLTGDCVVGFSDLNIVVGTFGQSGAGVLGDADGDQVVGFSDLNIVLVQFGQSCE